jgi:hypothetical protein
VFTSCSSEKLRIAPDQVQIDTTHLRSQAPAKSALSRTDLALNNMSNARRAEPDRHFIEDVARLLVLWGVPQTAARLYGYLLLKAEPVSLDCIAADREISKTSASVAARLLEQYTLVRRLGERGSKRGPCTGHPTTPKAC